jgi:hypothetical protein
MVTSLARKAVGDFRRDSLSFYPESEPILEMLEADPDGKVSTALHRLRKAHIVSVFFHLIQAVVLAKSRHRVVSETTKAANECRRHARAVRAAARFAQSEIEIRHWAALAEVADELDARAEEHAAEPRRLQINHKIEGEAAEQLLALRHFHRELRKFGMKCKRPNEREAIVWLVEAALQCAIPTARALEARRGLGFADRQSTLESPKSNKPLKTR